MGVVALELPHPFAGSGRATQLSRHSEARAVTLAVTAHAHLLQHGDFGAGVGQRSEDQERQPRAQIGWQFAAADGERLEQHGRKHKEADAQECRSHYPKQMSILLLQDDRIPNREREIEHR